MPIWALTENTGLLYRVTRKDSLLEPFMALSVLPFEGASAPEDPSTVKSESFLAGKTLARLVTQALASFVRTLIEI